MSIKDELSTLRSEYSRITARIQELMSQCQHQDGYFVGFWSWRVGSIEVCRICNECGGTVAGLTEEERTQFNLSEEFRLTSWKAENFAWDMSVRKD